MLIFRGTEISWCITSIPYKHLSAWFFFFSSLMQWIIRSDYLWYKKCISNCIFHTAFKTAIETNNNSPITFFNLTVQELHKGHKRFTLGFCGLIWTGNYCWLCIKTIYCDWSSSLASKHNASPFTKSLQYFSNLSLGSSNNILLGSDQLQLITNSPESSKVLFFLKKYPHFLSF